MAASSTEGLRRISHDRANTLRAELQGYDADTEPMDGLTAAVSLRKVVNAFKDNDPPVIVSGGSPLSIPDSVQERLF